MHAKHLIYGVMLLAIAFMCSGCEFNSRVREHKGGEANLRVGMTKAEVVSLLGKPANPENETVWVYCDSACAGTWKSLLYEHKAPYFMLFEHDVLLIPRLIKATESTPWEVLRWEAKWPKSKIDALIGDDPT